MRSIYIKSTELELIAKPHATFDEAVKECLFFMKTENIESCTLELHGFTMLIDQDTVITELKEEFLSWFSKRAVK